MLKNAAFFMLFLMLTAGVVFAGGQTAAKGAYMPKNGEIRTADPSLTGGAEVFVYVPNGIKANSKITEPIVMVFGDKDFTAETAAELAETSGIWQKAQREDSVIAFVNSKGAEWGAEDVTAYKAIVHDLFTDRIEKAGGNGVTWLEADNNFSNGKYSGYQGLRQFAIGEGSGADFISGSLVDDSLELPDVWGSKYAAPVGVLLFNSTVLPKQSTMGEMEYPAIIVNGSQAVVDAYKKLNNDDKRVVSLTSSKKNGFDNAALLVQFDNLISVRRIGLGAGSTNVTLFDVPLFETLGITMEEKTINLSNGQNIMYQTFMNGNVKNAAAGSIPLIMVYHGGTDTAEFVTTVSGFPELTGRENVLVVAVDNHLIISDRSLDPLYLNMEIVDKVIQDNPQIDETRIYASGFSRGSVKSFDLGFNFTRRFAGIMPNHCMTGNSTLETILDKNNLNFKIPVYYMDGHEDPTSSIFVDGSGIPTDISAETRPTDSKALRARDTLDIIFKMNDIRNGDYEFDATAGNPFGIKFDTEKNLAVTHGDSVMTERSLVSNDGVVYTKIADSTALTHHMFPDDLQYAWDFISQFSRRADGAILVNGKLPNSN